MQDDGSHPRQDRDINGSKETLKLAVRITNLWFAGTPDKSEQAEMVIVDSNVSLLFFFLWVNFSFLKFFS